MGRARQTCRHVAHTLRDECGANASARQHSGAVAARAGQAEPRKRTEQVPPWPAARGKGACTQGRAHGTRGRDKVTKVRCPANSAQGLATCGSRRSAEHSWSPPDSARPLSLLSELCVVRASLYLPHFPHSSPLSVYILQECVRREYYPIGCEIFSPYFFRS